MGVDCISHPIILRFISSPPSVSDLCQVVFTRVYFVYCLQACSCLLIKQVDNGCNDVFFNKSTSDNKPQTLMRFDIKAV